jgi:glycosyltransferase involved in cell wall biosynthesis
MRVAVLAHSFPRFPGDTHGPFVKHLSESLAARGHRVWVLVPYDPAIERDPATPLTIRSFRYVWPDRWHRLGYSRTLRRDVGMTATSYLQAPLYFLFAERALSRLVRRERIDLVHAHWILPNGFVAARVSRATGVPYAVTLHGSDVFMAERNPLFGAMARRALAGASHVTSCSGELRDRLLRLGGAEHGAKVHLVPNGTEAEPAAGTGERHPAVPVGCRAVVAVGRLVDKKGFGYLLEAAPRIFERVPDACIVLGGGGPLEGALREQAARLGIADRVVFTGLLPHPDVLRLMASAEVVAMPSVRDERGNVDGLPVVVLEAMAAARPVVASAISGMPLAIEDGVNGRLVPERDPEALAGAIIDLLADPATARRLGAAARRRVEEELNWDAVAGIHDRLYREAVGPDFEEDGEAREEAAP